MNFAPWRITKLEPACAPMSCPVDHRAPGGDEMHRAVPEEDHQRSQIALPGAWLSFCRPWRAAAPGPAARHRPPPRTCQRPGQRTRRKIPGPRQKVTAKANSGQLLCSRRRAEPLLAPLNRPPPPASTASVFSGRRSSSSGADRQPSACRATNAAPTANPEPRRMGVSPAPARNDKRGKRCPKGGLLFCSFPAPPAVTNRMLPAAPAWCSSPRPPPATASMNPPPNPARKRRKRVRGGTGGVVKMASKAPQLLGMSRVALRRGSAPVLPDSSPHLSRYAKLFSIG